MRRVCTWVVVGVLLLTRMAPVTAAANPILTFDAVVDTIWGQAPASVMVGDAAFGRISYHLENITWLDEDNCRLFRFTAERRSTLQMTIREYIWVTTVKGIMIPDEYGADVCEGSVDELEFDGDAVSPNEYPGYNGSGVISILFQDTTSALLDGNDLPAETRDLPFTPDGSRGFIAGGTLATGLWLIWFHAVNPPARLPVHPTTWSQVKRLYLRP